MIKPVSKKQWITPQILFIGSGYVNGGGVPAPNETAILSTFAIPGNPGHYHFHTKNGNGTATHTKLFYHS